jgi:hypothetical protein
MTFGSLALIFSVCFAFAAAANAQLAESDGPSERDDRTAAPLRWQMDNELAVAAVPLCVGRKRLAVRIPCSSHLAGEPL